MLQVQLIGNLGADPEMRYMPDGQPMTSFSVACHNRKTRDETSFLYPDSGIYLYRRESGFMSKTEPYEDAVTFRRTLC